MKYLIISILAIFTLSACNSTEKPNQDAPPTANPEPIPPIIGFSIVNTHPKDSSYFTEGLEFHDGKLLESSGGNNEESPYPSAFGFVNFKTGKNDTKIVLDKSQYFGEGITVFNNTIYQLTWKGKKGFIYDYPSFKKKGEFIIPSPEGWGLTHDTSNLIMSDGSNSIYFLNPSTLQVTNIIGILDNSGPVGNINELEYVDGYLYANRWLTPYILKIDIKTGKVVGRIDFSQIESEITRKYEFAREFNGIAFNKSTGTFFVTGKKWPVFYEIKLQ